MNLFYSFTKCCSLFSVVMFLFFTWDIALRNDFSKVAAGFVDEEALDSDSTYFELSLPCVEVSAVDEEASAAKEAVLAAIPKNLADKITSSVSSSDFLTIQQLSGRQNFPQTSWNVFRMEVWKTAEETKAQYPNLNCSQLQLYDWMMKTFRIESGFQSGVKNRFGSAAGIFQITKGNRKTLGFPSNWTDLSEVEQLKWYKVYLFHCLDRNGFDHSKIKDRCDFYMINFMPAYATSGDDKVIATACGGTCRKYGKSKHYCAYHANSAFDLNKDAKIQKYEVSNVLDRKFTPKQPKVRKSKKLSSVDSKLGQDASFDYVKVNLNSEHFDMIAYLLKSPLTNISLF